MKKQREDVEDLANERLSGEISYSKARGERTVLVAPFS